MERTEIEEAVSEVARKHNLLLSPDDPLLVTITLNEVMLRRLLERQAEALQAAQDEIAAGAAQQIEAAREIAGLVITGATEFVVGELRSAATALNAELLAAAERERKLAVAAAISAQRAQRHAWAAVAVAAALTSLVFGVIIGWVAEPAPSQLPAPAPTSAAQR
jgi:hypothetical protein